MFRLFKRKERESDVVVMVRVFPPNIRSYSEYEFARFRDTRRGWLRAYEAISQAEKIHGSVHSRVWVYYGHIIFLPEDVRDEIRARGWIR
jgi:hypothetical protein